MNQQLKGRRLLSPEERFWPKVDKTESCWLWTAHTAGGYGQFAAEARRSVGVQQVPAHRWAYELLVGPIPEGMQLDHLCRNPLCVNPAHLEPVTGAENRRRAPGTWTALGTRTHCKNGHEFTAENTRVMADHRRCRQCAREATRRWVARNKEEIPS